MNRRQFTRVTAASMSAASYMRIMGANDKVNLGLIGAGGRGKGVMGTFQKTDQVNVTAVCDVYAARVDEGLSRAPGAKGVDDHRKLLEMKDVDAVLRSEEHTSELQSQ